MFLHIHIPIIDCREFLVSCRKFEKPVYPVPVAGSFVQNFGEVCYREKGGNPFYAGESHFFNTFGAIRFKNLPRYNVRISKSPADEGYTYICKFRRLFTNGEIMNRYELGFSLYSGKADFKEVAGYILDQDIRIRDFQGEFVQTQLWNAGTYIAGIYDFSTSAVPSIGSVICGEVFCVAELNNSDSTSIPEKAVKLLDFKKEGIRLYHYVCKVPKRKVGIPCWIIDKYRRHSDPEFASKLRNALFRVQLEVQTLMQSYPFLIGNVNNKDLDSQKLVDYISKVQDKLLRASRFEIRSDKIVYTALRATYTMQPGQIADMLDMVRRIGDKYMTADFLQLLIPLQISEWKSLIENELRKKWNPGTKSQLEALRDECTPSSYKKFIRFLSGHKGEIWDILKEVIPSLLKKGG